MSSEGAPESWDQDVSNNLASKLTLNVNATEFVPSWGAPAAPKQSAVTSNQPPIANATASPVHSVSVGKKIDHGLAVRAIMLLAFSPEKSCVILGQPPI